MFRLFRGLSSRCTYTTGAWREYRHSRSRSVNPRVLLASCGVATLAGVSWAKYNSRASNDEESSGGQIKTRPGLEDYKLKEVAKHKNAETGVWVTYKDGVYDVTEFIDIHPGGREKIMLAAGASIEPFWEVFASHNADEVKEMLEELRIGNVHPSDREEHVGTGKKREGPYANDPKRSPVFKINTHTPFDAETPIVLLTDSYLTPNKIFFVRNHLPVPLVDPKKYSLEVKCQGQEPVELTLEDLKTKFEQYTITATIQCAGNRRSELAKIKPLRGLSCTEGALGNATWAGPRLRDILMYAGMKESEDYVLKHIHLEGLDNDSLTGERYGASIPIEKAMDPRGDCLLALEMNGESIPRDHGYPVRAVVPGVVGARNVKWLARIEAHKEEYSGLWQQKHYKGFSPSVGWDTVDFGTAPSIQELPVTSLICSLQEGVTVQRSEEGVMVKGVAWSGGGREVIRVDVSSDGGKTWQVAELIKDEEQPLGRAWAWKRWEVTVPLPSAGDVQLCCKAVDISYNVQPDTAAPIWNLGGYLCNTWHRVDLKVK